MAASGILLFIWFR